MNIGRFKKTLKDKCPECGALLQLRVINEWVIEYGQEIQIDNEYAICPDCGHEVGYSKSKNKNRKQKRRKFFEQ